MKNYLLLSAAAVYFCGLPLHSLAQDMPLAEGVQEAQDTHQYSNIGSIIQYTYDHNPTLLAAREELKATKELYPQARSNWRPTLSAEASLYSTDVESSNFGSADGATTKDLSLNLDQPIWRGGRTFAEVDRAHDLIKVGEATLRQAEQDIFIDAITAYLNTIRDQQLLNLRAQNKDILLKELKAAWARKEIGDITDTDVQQAKARLSRAQSEHEQAKADYAISKAEFQQIIGLPARTDLSLLYPDFNLSEDPDKLFEFAEHYNPEIISAIYQHKASSHFSDATFRELFPQISAFASMNKQYDPQPGIVDETTTETIGLRATLTLYQGGATRSRVREAKNNQKRREYQIEETKRRIKQEVIANLRSYISAKSQTENRKEEIEAAAFALKGVKIEASEGQRSVLDILDADQELINAKASLIRAQRNEALMQYALASSLGLLDLKALRGY